MTKLDDKLQLDYVSYRIANDIADQFTTGFCNDKMVKKFEKIVKEHIKTLKLEQETKDTELRDHFAGLAMQSLLTKVSTTVGSDSVAMAAYHVAHQMLKERSRGEKPNEIL